MSPAMSPEQALARLDPAVAGRARVRERLRCTPVSTTWLVDLGRQRAVLRMDGPGARALGLDRDREWTVMQAAGHLAPRPLARDAAAGVLLRAYAPGTVVPASQLRSAAGLAGLGALLRRIHGLPLAGPPLDCAAAIQRYARLAGAGAEGEARRARAALAAARAHGGQLCQCHNDPVAGNLVWDRDLHLIDWEYAAPHDPWFDLAAVAAHHGLTRLEQIALLQAYLGEAPGAAQRRRLQDWMALYQALAGLWARAVAALPPGPWGGGP